MRRLLAALGILALAGCAVAPTDFYGDDGGLTLAVVQSRDDHGARIVAIEVHSDRDDDVTLTRATLETAQLSEAAVWQRGTVLRGGLTLDLRVQLPAAACPIADDVTPTVTVEFTTAEGVQRTVSGTPAQPADALSFIAAEDCIAAALNDQAEVTVKSVEYTPGAGGYAVLVVGIDPRDVDGSVTIETVGATVLIGLVAPTGGLTQKYPLDRVVERGGDSSDLRITVVPNRCDSHAIAEDKRGTYLPLEIAASSGVHGIYYLAVSDDQKGQIYSFVTDYCASAPERGEGRGIIHGLRKPPGLVSSEQLTWCSSFGSEHLPVRDTSTSLTGFMCGSANGAARPSITVQTVPRQLCPDRTEWHPHFWWQCWHYAIAGGGSAPRDEVKRSQWNR
jgi:hypothetical protein